MKKIVTTKKAPPAAGPYSQAVAAGGFVFISGQIPLTPDGERVEGGIREQTVRVMENLGSVLEAAGLTFADVVRTTVYLDTIADFSLFNDVYAGYFSEDPPARACLEASALPKGSLVEISAIAREPSGE